MFDSLKKKLSGWLGVGKKEEEKEKPKKETEREKKVEKTGMGKGERKKARGKVVAEKKEVKTRREKEKKTEKKEEVKKKEETEKKISKKGELKNKEIKVKRERREVEENVEEKEVEVEIEEEGVIEIPSNSVTLESEISNRHSRTKGDTINGNVYKKKDEEIIDVEIKEEIKVEDAGKGREESEKEGGWLKKWWKKKEEIKEREKVEGEKEAEKEAEEEKEKKVEVEIKEEINIEGRREGEEEGEKTPKEELKEEIEEEGGFFAKLKKKLTNSTLRKEEFEEIFPELEFNLLENNVALDVVDKIKESLSNDLVGISIKKSEVEKKIVESLKSAILKVLVEGEELIEKIKESRESPFVILFFGINGSGKTTSVAKIAYKLKKEGVSCVLAAGDTFRAASIEQLEKHAEKIGVPIIKGEYGKDPASVGFDAVQYAKKNKIKVVLVDTAGRMYTKSNLMKEMEKIVKVTKPNLKIFVGESITGNDATEQAKMFNETAGIDGIILTKADVDEKAGAILSVGFVTGKPIFYLGVGQDYDDLKEFKKSDVLKGIGLE